MIGENPSFSVSEFVGIFNQSLEMMYPQVAITGELSNFKISKNRWVYFDLKDEYSSVRFFGTVYSLPGPLEDGMMCQVVGRPKLHQQFGFSIQVDSIRAVGEGALRRAQDLLRQKLAAEGLFSDERKRSLPYPPKKIGLITSAESAAIADFRKIINARWPALDIVLKDCLVQGANAPAAIVKAIQEINMSSESPDVIVLIRGGGSADDLAAFSDESVVRAVAGSRLPTLVAIGHENDTSLAELAADKRASTPSNAAELLVPDIRHEVQLLRSLEIDLDRCLKLTANRAVEEVAAMKITLTANLKSILLHHGHELDSQKMLLKALDPVAPLQQGYVLIRNQAGAHIKKAADLPSTEVFSLEFIDGKKQARQVSDEQ